MKQDITTLRIRKRQNRAQRPAFAFQEPLYAGFSAGSPVLNEVVLEGELSGVRGDGVLRSSAKGLLRSRCQILDLAATRCCSASAYENG